MIDLYMSTFTEDDLREMTTVYKTPTGQKNLSTLGDLMQKSAKKAPNGGAPPD